MQPSARNARQQAAGRTVANILLEIKAVNFRPEQPYTLTAGWASPVYIDCRKLISFPRARRKVTELARLEIEETIGHENIDAVAGGETAGIPYAAWIADALMLPMQYVRKKPKGFGRMAQIEGDLREGSRVVLVEDLASDGGSKLLFVKALRDAGATCHHCFVVFF
jgi:orotate phosphoribosyltransferase